MTKTKKTIIGLLTFSPIFAIIGLIFFFVVIFDSIPSGAMQHGPSPEDTASAISDVFGFIFLLAILSIALRIYYIVDIVNNPRFQEPGDNNKVIWILLVLLVGFLGMVVYFFTEIMPRAELATEEEFL